jgi:hypothetical protein
LIGISDADRNGSGKAGLADGVKVDAVAPGVDEGGELGLEGLEAFRGEIAFEYGILYPFAEVLEGADDFGAAAVGGDVIGNDDDH